MHIDTGRKDVSQLQEQQTAVVATDKAACEVIATEQVRKLSPVVAHRWIRVDLFFTHCLSSSVAPLRSVVSSLEGMMAKMSLTS